MDIEADVKKPGDHYELVSVTQSPS